MQIHDSDMITGHPLEKIINGPAHHTLHHLYFTVNYGQVICCHYVFSLTLVANSLVQYFTFSDRWAGSYRQPASELDPMLEVKMLEEKKRKEAIGKDQ